MSSMQVTIKWFKPVHMFELRSDGEPGSCHGLYLWLFPDESTVTYVGETGKTFAKRMEEHWCNTVSCGGTGFDPTATQDEVVRILVTEDPLTVSRPPLHLASDPQSMLAKLADPEQLGKVVAHMVGYMAKVKVLCGELSLAQAATPGAEARQRREIEAAIGFYLDHVKGWRAKYRSGKDYRVLGPTRNPPVGWDYEIAGIGAGSAVASGILGGNPAHLRDPGRRRK